MEVWYSLFDMYSISFSAITGIVAHSALKICNITRLDNIEFITVKADTLKPCF